MSTAPTVHPPDRATYPWLGPGALEVIGGDFELRSNHFKRKEWISYTFADTCLANLSLICKGDPTHRPECRLILSPAGNGKSMILNKLYSMVPKLEGSAHAQHIPVIKINAPPQPNLSALCNLLLTQTGAPILKGEPAVQCLVRTCDLLQSVGLRVLIIDEIQDILSGKTEHYRTMRKSLRYISNQVKVSIIAAGTKEARTPINEDPTLRSRFQPLILPRWGNNAAFRDLLSKFQKQLPLRNESNLLEPSVQERIFKASEGRIGEVFNLLSHALEVAIKSEMERIDHDVLDYSGCMAPCANWEVEHDLD